MTPSRDPARQCKGKRVYRRKRDAKLAARRRNNHRVEAYRCPHCGGYHLGTKTNRRKKEEPDG